jgi:predicted N-acetyltransferase YhbS
MDTARAIDRPLAASDITVRMLEERDFPAANRLIRLAFGTLLGLDDVGSFKADADSVRVRWCVDPSAAFVADVDGAVVGTVFSTNWGTFGFPGPMGIHPSMWSRGVGRTLLKRTMACFTEWGTQHIIFFTYGNSPRHVGWYQRIEMWPRYLTAILEKTALLRDTGVQMNTFSEVAERDRDAVLAECRAVADTIYPGLDLTREIRAVAAHRFGDTVLLWDNSRLNGFAVCHCGAGTEARSGTCYIKFGGVRSGPNAPRALDALMDQCEALTLRAGLSRLSVGVNTARREAYQQMLARRFHIELLGVAMHQRNVIGFNRPGIYALDDCR